VAHLRKASINLYYRRSRRWAKGGPRVGFLAQRTEKHEKERFFVATLKTNVLICLHHDNTRRQHDTAKQQTGINDNGRRFKYR
jgi:hypothetical protein